MGDKQNAQTLGKHQIVESLDREFARLHDRSCQIVESTPREILYQTTNTGQQFSAASVGESVLRSAAAIESTFGGITANLWDDPFEWTLPEHLSTPEKVLEHLCEVETFRGRAFASFTEDACLLKHVATPADETRPLIELLVDTLVRAAVYQGQAIAARKTLSGIAAPGFII
jgi:hypothetical protein